VSFLVVVASRDTLFDTETEALLTQVTIAGMKFLASVAKRLAELETVAEVLRV
jgi:hypothetical protein